MKKYKGKAKCSCGKRARWVAYKFTHPVYTCGEHKATLEKLSDYEDNKDMTEADYQTWFRL